MKRPKLIRSLRIAWSVAWGLLAVLLCVLWVRSYWAINIWNLSGPHTLMSFGGKVLIDESFVRTNRIAPEDPNQNIQTFSSGPRYIYEPAGTGVTIGYWFPSMLALAVTTAPWLPWWSIRFSLRTLLIATTLVAVVLGLFAWLSK
jgi:hypothetical protein